MEPPTAPPRLEILPRSSPHTFLTPAKRINEGPDVERFLVSKAYRDICTFVLQLNRALIPRKRDNNHNNSQMTTSKPPLPSVQTFPLSRRRRDPEIVRSLQRLLEWVEGMVDEAPPDPGPRRFGNVSFRRWHGLLEERAEGLLREFLVLPEGVTTKEKEGAEGEAEDEGGDTALAELKAYFLGGFGSAQRLDYGTGHELSFVAFLGCLWKLGAFVEEEGADGGEAREPGEIERSIVLGVIEPYLKVIRHLILRYTLEPAGSHGVWGLDDHSFLPYIFGSAQLSRPISSESEPTPLEGSCPGAPKPADVVKPDKVALYRGENMYFSAVGFINDVKKGPFWEHSPILFDVSGIKDGWGKINKGMIKMFNAEVLSKFPVVQHFPFGSLFSWDRDPHAAVPVTSVHMANQPVPAVPSAASSEANKAGGTSISAASSASRAPGGARAAAAAAAAAAFDSVVAAGGASTTATTSAPWARPPGDAAAAVGGGGGGGGVPYTRMSRPGAAASSGPLPPASVMPVPRGGAPNTGPLPPASFPRGVPGQANNQFSVTKAPWAKD